jgi:hypothetical protein
MLLLSGVFFCACDTAMGLARPRLYRSSAAEVEARMGRLASSSYYLRSFAAAPALWLMSAVWGFLFALGAAEDVGLLTLDRWPWIWRVLGGLGLAVMAPALSAFFFGYPRSFLLPAFRDRSPWTGDHPD